MPELNIGVRKPSAIVHTIPPSHEVHSMYPWLNKHDHFPIDADGSQFGSKIQSTFKYVPVCLLIFFIYALNLIKRHLQWCCVMPSVMLYGPMFGC